MDLSIIIVNFDTKELLKNCLDSIFKSLKKTKLNFEVIVVDNASTDGSADLVREIVRKYSYSFVSGTESHQENRKVRVPPIGENSHKPTLRLIKNRTNLGFGKANNQAIRKAQGEYVLLLNSDTEIIDDGIERLLSVMKENKNVDIAGGKLFNKDGTVQASCGSFYSLPICFLMLFLKGDSLKLTRWSPEQIREVDWVSGACLMAKRSVFEKLSFDEDIFMYMDEVEFLYRAKKTGFKVFFYPKAKFSHLGAASSTGRKTPVLNIYRGLLYFYKKHHPGWRFFLLKLMLKAKAIGAYFLGVLTRDNYLKETYVEAYALVR